MRKRRGFSAIDFFLDTKSANLAEITLTSRYPENGFTMNTKSEMLVYIKSGKVAFTQSKKKILEKGQAVLVKTNEKYFWQPMKKVVLIVFSTPAWTPEQQQLS